MERYRAERAISTDESVSWVVVDDRYRLHGEACAFLAGLRGADRSVNTERVYAALRAVRMASSARCGPGY